MRLANLVKGALAGAIAGAIASAVMNRLVGFYPSESAGRGHGAQSLQPGQPEHGFGLRQIRRDGAWRHHQEDATERLAECLIWEIIGVHLTARQKQTLGTLVHYLFGSSSAAGYGLLAEFLPASRTGLGVPFGTAVWLGADEGAVPLLGLSRDPSEQSLLVHLTSMGSHWIYGLTTELMRRQLRASWLR
ncbi:MAG: DUF1440 domain-containing protein [Candidatus Eremiobacteraeota bacterium]|nr:DUF1440 domain-containing protein [Candidatus Eremiobacteraeota bacterium]MCW5867160.1 DUF1440 domain-containing protein [Candidatus Eremiobacteraeota bacterium]